VSPPISVGITAMLLGVVAAAWRVIASRPATTATMTAAATPIHRALFDMRGAAPVIASGVAGTALVGIEPPLGVVI